MAEADFEIAFPPPRNFKPVPPRGIISALGFDFKLLRRSGPEPPPAESSLIGDLGRLLVWPDFFLAGPVLGAPMAVMVLEDMLRRGANEIIFIGLAGSLGSCFQAGDIVCPEDGLSTEGCSGHYPASTEPDADLRNSLMAGAKGRVQGGRIWSTDGIYRETFALVEAQKARGAQLVDMECTALWAAAAFRKVRLISLVVVSDVLDGTEHKTGFHLPQFKSGLKEASELAWQALTARLDCSR